MSCLQVGRVAEQIKNHYKECVLIVLPWCPNEYVNICLGATVSSHVYAWCALVLVSIRNSFAIHKLFCPCLNLHFNIARKIKTCQTSCGDFSLKFWLRLRLLMNLSKYGWLHLPLHSGSCWKFSSQMSFRTGLFAVWFWALNLEFLVKLQYKLPKLEYFSL